MIHFLYNNNINKFLHLKNNFYYQSLINGLKTKNLKYSRDVQFLKPLTALIVEFSVNAT